MSEDPKKAPPDEGATVIDASAFDVEPEATLDPAEAHTRAIEDGARAGEPATVAIDHEGTAKRLAREADDARRDQADAPTEYEGSHREREEMPPEIAPGTILFGEYEVAECIGTGGRGEVYRARHRRLDEDRAIKMIRPIYTADKAAGRFFDREARSLLKIHHPAVVRCHDMLSDETGRVYLVMEFVEGRSLAAHLLDGPLNQTQIEALAGRLAAGLTAAHAEGVVHRDLSPDNVVLPGDSFASAKLIDFGIAKEVEHTETTILDGFKGKVLYASPEQIGFYEGAVDRRSDYFSLGLVLAAAALGRPLNMGGSLIQAVEARRSTPVLPPEMPDGIRKLILPLLEVDPARRPDSLDALMPERALTGVVGRTAGGGARGWTHVAAGLGGVAVAAGGVWLWWSQEAPPPVEPEVPVLEREAALPPPTVVVPEPIAPAAAPEPAPIVKQPEPEPPRPVAKPRGPSASDRAALLRGELRVEGLMAGARSALAEGRLTTPKGDNAVEKLEAVLKLDPKNSEARSSLTAVGGRYLELAAAAIESGEIDTARGYIDTAAKLAPAHPGLAKARAALAAAR